MGKGYMFMKCFANHLLSFVQLWASTELGLRAAGNHEVLEDLLLFGLITFNGEDALQGERQRSFWNCFIKNGSEVEYQKLKGTGMAHYSSTTQLLMYHLVNSNCMVTYDQQLAELDM